MAKDLYEGRKMFQGPFFFIIIIPIGMIALFMLLDFGIKTVNEYDLKKFTKELLTEMMENPEITDYRTYAINRYGDEGYDTESMSLVEEDGKVILINYKFYFSMMGQITGKKNNLATARFIAYYDKNKNLIVEEFKPEDDMEGVDDLNINTSIN